MVDLAATGTGQIALVQRLQHQYEWISLYAAQFAAGNVSPNAVRLK
jgi:hypothetical protein